MLNHPTKKNKRVDIFSPFETTRDGYLQTQKKPSLEL